MIWLQCKGHQVWQSKDNFINSSPGEPRDSKPQVTLICPKQSCVLTSECTTLQKSLSVWFKTCQRWYTETEWFSRSACCTLRVIHCNEAMQHHLCRVNSSKREMIHQVALLVGGFQRIPAYGVSEGSILLTVLLWACRCQNHGLIPNLWCRPKGISVKHWHNRPFFSCNWII